MGKMENPGALAGATGAEFEAASFRAQEYQDRANAATALCCAIADCHRDDAVVILHAALQDLSARAPLPVFMNAMAEARWWANYAAPHELKAYGVACVEAMLPKVRAAFLAYLLRGAMA